MIASSNINAFFQLISFTFQQANDDIKFVLLEDSLLLWYALCKLTGIPYNKSLHDLFAVILDIYSLDNKLFPVLMNLIDWYIQSGKQTFLAAYQGALTGIYSTYFSVVSPKELPRLVSSVHALLICYPMEGSFIISPLLDSLLSLILNKHQGEQIEKYAIQKGDF